LPALQFDPQFAAASPQTLLVVDDDAEIRSLLAERLELAGYKVIAASNGVEMFSALNKFDVALIILDLNLPGQDGLSLCRETRSRCDIPIIMLTARSDAIDRVIGLEVGADDYVIKPFEPRELVARVRTVMRRLSPRNSPSAPAVVKRARFRNWVLDFENRCLTDAEDRVVMVTGTEFSLLKFLVEHANEVVSRDDLLAVVSPLASGYASVQRVDLHISRLRHKLADSVSHPNLIVTIRTQGYVLAASVTFE
jgi:two-component system OmpR family response regulator